MKRKKHLSCSLNLIKENKKKEEDRAKAEESRTPEMRKPRGDGVLERQ